MIDGTSLERELTANSAAVSPTLMAKNIVKHISTEGQWVQHRRPISRSMVPAGLKKPLSFEAVRLASQERVQHPRSCGLVGPEQTTRPAPTLQQWQKVLVKLGFLGSQSTVARQKCPLVKLGFMAQSKWYEQVPSLQQP